MIQVCSRCAARWNVRDTQRVWCPRCNGALLAPPPSMDRPPAGPLNRDRHRAQRDAVESRTGFRWIAVRPGPPPPPRARRQSLGPTPRYQTTPRWGLSDRPAAGIPPAAEVPRKSASDVAVRATLLASAAVFSLAALVHILRYLLLLINRTTLLPPLVANGTLLMGVLASLAAMVAVIVTAATMTSWLVGRRAAVFRFLGHDDPRSEWELWAGCMIPVANLIWAPVFLLELARAEQSEARLRGPIVMWWVAWVFSTGISAWAMWTSTATEAQGVADNTVTVIIAYLAGLAVLLLLWRVFNTFVRKSVERPLHRWVIVPEDQADMEPQNESTPDDISGDVPDDVELEPDLRPGQREPVA